MKYPVFFAIYITASSHWVLDTMIDYVKLPEKEHERAKIFVRYLSFGFGALSLLDLDKYYAVKIYRNEIDLLCLKQRPNDISNYQTEVLEGICTKHERNSLDDLKMICSIMGDQDLCLDV